MTRINSRTIPAVLLALAVGGCADESLPTDPTATAAYEWSGAKSGDDARHGKPLPLHAANFEAQWNMKIVEAPFAWTAGDFGSPTVRVFILDTGIDYTRIDLRSHVDPTRSVSLVGNSGGEQDSARIRAVEPWMDFHSHGTAVASTIVSNGIDLAGVTTRTKVVAVKVQDRFRAGQFDTFVAGIRYAADSGADVIHLSLANAAFAHNSAGAANRIARFDSATTYAHERGAVIVAAGGNASQNLDSTIWRPCNAKHVICVSATNAADDSASYTAYGVKTVTLSGPGGEVAMPVLVNCSSFSLIRTGNPAPCGAGKPRYETTGTTFGAAVASGLAALVISRIGQNQPERVREILVLSADDLGPKGHDAYYGYGRVNVRKALELIDSEPLEVIAARGPMGGP